MRLRSPPASATGFRNFSAPCMQEAVVPRMPPEISRRPGARTATRPPIDTTTTAEATDSATGRQVPPVGPHPTVDVLLVGALLWCPDDGAEVLALVADSDIEDPALAAVLTAVRTLLDAGKPAGPQLVADELSRTGRYRGTVPDRLRAATTSGAAVASRAYAAAVVAAALRRQVESAGQSLTTAATEAAECELALLSERLAADIAKCARRLELLRGDAN